MGISQQPVGIALVRSCITVLDQEPVVAFRLAFAIPAHAHQHPTSVQALAVEREFQVALRQPLVRVDLGFPIAAVPELHRAGAILALRDRALEVAVVERMILDLDREPLVVRIERGALGHRP
jgi:hypothetical protein